jgi:hypothetical protein
MTNEQQDNDGLVARLKLHSTWRDSHGELNDAPNEAATTIEAMSRQLVEKDDLIDRLVEHAVGFGAFDEDSDLWREAAAATNRDVDTGNRQ